jgi:hypothetical protein
MKGNPMLVETRKWMRFMEAANTIGLKRARMFELIKESNGEIKSCVLKSPGAKRGAKLINMASLFAYLDKLASERQKAEGQCHGA